MGSKMVECIVKKLAAFVADVLQLAPAAATQQYVSIAVSARAGVLGNANIEG
jgi:hypothetical protein